MNDYVNDHDLPDRVGVADPIARQGEGLGSSLPQGVSMLTFCVSAVTVASCRRTRVGWALQSPTANGNAGSPSGEAVPRPVEAPRAESAKPTPSPDRARAWSLRL